VLHLRVFGAPPTIRRVAEHLETLAGSRHVVRSEDGKSGLVLVTADLLPDAADVALEAVFRLGVASEDVELLRLESIGPATAGRPHGSVIWADLLSQAGANARPLVRYLVFMAVAGIIAAFGVIYDNGILIVGAMAISPDTLPVTATCTGLVLRRWALARRAFATLTAGLAFSCAVAGAMTLALNTLGLLPSGFKIGAASLDGLTTVNIATPIVALAAGVAAVLALETRSSSSVGVAISVTTIPASAYLGVAAGVAENAKAGGALLVLAINVVMLIVGGCCLLLVQERFGRGEPRAAAATVPPTAESRAAP
jgi:uncharacterized hydrophobic protein (TIGR00271 family)